MVDNQFDVIVVGAGPGGYVTAIKAAQEGFKTLIVEKENYGGVCLNVGCIPTKTLLKQSKVFETIMHAAEFGVNVADLSKVTVDWKKMQDRKNSVVKKLTGGVEFLLGKNKVTRVKGTAIPVDTNSIKVNDTVYSGKNIIIATGSEPRKLNLPGFDEHRSQGVVINSTQALSLSAVPKELVIIGGGVIGIEFAFMYRRLNTKVTILQGLDTILEFLDESVIAEVTKMLKTRGVEILTNVKIESIKNKKINFTDKDGKSQSLGFDYCLESVGRAPVTAGFEKIVKTGPRGNIEVDDYLTTNVPNVYAIGDVNGKMMLAHVASSQGLAVISGLKGKKYKLNYEQIPNCIYVFPEVAAIGLTEKQAKERNIAYKTFTFPIAGNGKALADGESEGFAKLIVGAKYHELIGAHIICGAANEMISQITNLMACEATLEEIVRIVYPHPTLSEIVMEAAHGAESKAIHI